LTNRKRSLQTESPTYVTYETNEEISRGQTQSVSNIKCSGKKKTINSSV